MPFDPGNDCHKDHRIGRRRAARLGAMIGAAPGATNRAGGCGLQRAMLATKGRRRSCRGLVR